MNPTHGDIVLFAYPWPWVAARVINIISIKAVSALYDICVFFKITGSVVAVAAGCSSARSSSSTTTAGFPIRFISQRTQGSALCIRLPCWRRCCRSTAIGWEGAADLSEETPTRGRARSLRHDPAQPRVGPRPAGR